MAIHGLNNKQFDYDVAILGGGSAGYAAARTAVAAGLRTVVIESGAEVGGLCILRGCMPTKALLYAAEVMQHARHVEPWGIRTEHVGFDFTKVMARKDAFIADLAIDRRKELASGDFMFIRGQASFLDPHTLAVTDHGTLSAGHVVIATGSSVAPSSLPGLHAAGFLTSDDALKLTELPESLVVLGGGAVAVEFAQFFARFGVHVTILQRGDHLLSKFDTDAATEIERIFRRDGVDIFTHVELIDARSVGRQKTVSFRHHEETRSVTAEAILLALGREPNTATLDLSKAGVATERGRILANPFMQTSAPHIYTAGDCTGPSDVVHLAVQQGEIAVHNIAHPDALRSCDERLLLAVIFIEPQVACVGLTEKLATSRNVPYLAAAHPFSELGKSIIMGATDGYVKLLAAPDSGEILGAACIGPYGGELIHEIVVAMAKRMTVHELAVLPHYHPTLAEIWTYPAAALADRISG
jgi:pyruvate/2-oxoglutarate dehydrogenase complex dihydrolipoamide dehydrogenase (E3) component